MHNPKSHRLSRFTACVQGGGGGDKGEQSLCQSHVKLVPSKWLLPTSGPMVQWSGHTLDNPLQCVTLLCRYQCVVEYLC